jgi:hypothetical protein
MKYLITRLNLKIFFSAFLLILFSNSYFISFLHKHDEINLHFHEENILTSDHTIKVNTDCTLCDIIINSRFFTINHKILYLNEITNLVRFFSHQITKKTFSNPGLKLGRAPPFNY